MRVKEGLYQAAQIAVAPFKNFGLGFVHTADDVLSVPVKLDDEFDSGRHPVASFVIGLPLTAPTSIVAGTIGGAVNVFARKYVD